MKNIIAGVLVIMVLVGAWVAFNNSTQNQLDEPIKVGVVIPLTGDAAKYGEPAQRVLQIALNEVNAAGGVNGRSLELVVEDGKCTGADAVSAMQKLVHVDKVQVVIGGICSGESIAITPVGEEAKVAILSPGSTSPALTNISKYFARNYPSALTQGVTLADVAYKDKNWRTVAFIEEQTDYAAGIHKAFADRFTMLGGSVTEEKFTTDTTDFRTIVAKVKAQSPDAVFVDTQTAAAASRVLNEIARSDWKPNILVSNIVIADAKTIADNAALLEGALGAEYTVDDENPSFAALVARYKELYGEDLPYQSYAQAEYDAVYLVRDALTSVGNDGTRLANWLHSVTAWEGASGVYSINADGDPSVVFIPEVIRDGEKEIYKP